MSDALRQIEELRARLWQAEETLEAIRSGEVDALVVEGPDGQRVYTLEGAEQPYRVLVEAMNEGAVTLDEDGTVLYSNSPFAALMGVPLEQMLGSSVHQFVAPADDTPFRLLLGSRDGKAEIMLYGRGTPPAPTYVSVSPLGTSNVCLVVTDLTTQKRNEERLAAAQFARCVFEHATEAIIVCDERGRITHASVAAEALCGHDAVGEFIGDAFPLEHPAAAPDDESPAPMVSCLAETHLGHALHGVEGSLRCQGSAPRFISIGSGPLFGSGNQIIGSIFTLTDITDRKRIADAQREAAEMANRAKDDFLAMLSHEMRSPLGAITIWASLLRLGKLPQEKTAHAIRIDRAQRRHPVAASSRSSWTCRESSREARARRPVRRPRRGGGRGDRHRPRRGGCQGHSPGAADRLVGSGGGRLDSTSAGRLESSHERGQILRSRWASPAACSERGLARSDLGAGRG